MFARWTQRLNEFDRFQVLLALEDQVYSEVNQAYVSNEEIENYVTDKEFPSRIPSSHRDVVEKPKCLPCPATLLLNRSSPTRGRVVLPEQRHDLLHHSPDQRLDGKA